MKNIIFLFTFFIFSDLYAQKFENLATTPPMGWNSWNKFAENINEKTVKSAADAMNFNGMKDSGYQYIVIDDSWMIGRDSLGFILADPIKFPSGIKALSDYVHGKGLKFGIYTCAGRTTCLGGFMGNNNLSGSRGYEYQDALTFAKWGVDFLKEDWCNTDGQNAVESYTLMRDALYKAGRPIVLSICEWGFSGNTWEWAGKIGHMWRTCGDIQNNWNIPTAGNGKCTGGGVILNLDMQEGLESYAGPDHWNDPDMLQVGNGKLTQNENRAQFSLWCMLAAPLMAGNDIATMDMHTKEILTNREVIAIDQDSLGKQGFKIQDYGEIEIYYKPLQHGDVAICFFNRLERPVEIEFDWKNLSLKCWMDKQKLAVTPKMNRKDIKLEGNYELRDLWRKIDIGNTNQDLKAEIDVHDVITLKLTKKRDGSLNRQ